MTKLVKRARFNREVILLGRWRVPYAPAYGWRPKSLCRLIGHHYIEKFDSGTFCTRCGARP